MQTGAYCTYKEEVIVCNKSNSTIMRVKKHINKERQAALIDQLRDIVFPDKKPITLYTIDNSPELQERIMAMRDILRTEFYLQHETALQKPNVLKRPWLSLIKSILGKRYDLLIEDYRDREKGVRTKRYHLVDKTA